MYGSQKSDFEEESADFSDDVIGSLEDFDNDSIDLNDFEDDSQEGSQYLDESHMANVESLKVAKADKKMQDLISQKRQTGDGDRKVASEIFDKLTLQTLYKLANQGYLDLLNGAVSTGKEANVLKGVKDDGSYLAVKIYRIATSDFRKMQYAPQYRLVLFGPVPHSGHGKGDSGSIIAELEKSPAYPRVERMISGNELKITKSNFREMLERLIREDYI